MKIPISLARTMALLLTALLSSTILSVSAQRRPARRAQRSGTTAPRRAPAQTQRQTRRQTQPPAPSPTQAAPASQAGATQTPAPTAVAGAARPSPSGEPDRPLEELLAADAYGVYAEVRKVGTIFDMTEVKAALPTMALQDFRASGLLELANFIWENSETLGDARVAIATMATRANLPPTLVAVQLASGEAARAFEPKFRAFMETQLRALAPVEPAQTGRRGRRSAARSKPAPRMVVRRTGGWLVAAGTPFTLKRLGGAVGNSLADSARFQNLRSRFVNESVFIYFDTEQAQKGWMLSQQAAGETRNEPEEEQPQEAPAAPMDGEGDVTSEGATVAPAGGDNAGASGDASPPEPARAAVVTDANTAVTEPTTASASQQTATPTPTLEAVAAPEVQVPMSDEAPPTGKVAEGETAPPAESVEVRNASRSFDRLFGGLWGGIPRIPGAVAAGIGIEGGAMAIRVAVENPPGGATSLIPFLPNVVSGAPVTVEASAVAPVSNDILVATSLDWSQIFNSMLGTARQETMLRNASHMTAEEGEAGEAKAEPSPEEALATMEKLLGFKLREDLLPALGSEVAISLPLEPIIGRGSSSRRRPRPSAGGDDESAAREDENAPAPGFVALISLNNADAMRDMMPRIALLLGFGGGGGQGFAEKREGHEIRGAGPFVYAFLGRFLVISDKISSIRHAVDSFARGETLANQSAYRDATSWQSSQRLAHAYLSDAMMAATIRETKRMAENSSDPIVVSTLPQLDLQPEPISFATTNEGDVLIHELRLPINLGRVYGAAAVISGREGPNISAEAMAVHVMQSIFDAQEAYKSQKERGRFATLEELLASGLFDKGMLQYAEYRIEVNAVGDRFEATATPKQYGEKGRRSFYVDQSGVIRAADHKGRPATAEDPPVD